MARQWTLSISVRGFPISIQCTDCQLSDQLRLKFICIEVFIDFSIDFCNNAVSHKRRMVSPFSITDFGQERWVILNFWFLKIGCTAKNPEFPNQNIFLIISQGGAGFYNLIISPVWAIVHQQFCRLTIFTFSLGRWESHSPPFSSTACLTLKSIFTSIPS